jgi:hypothetical protein
MKHIKLFEDYHSQEQPELNEGLAEIVYLAKKCAVSTSIAAALLASPDLSAQDKSAIKQANPEAQVQQEPTGIGVGKSPDQEFSKEISMSRALAELAKNAKPSTDGSITYEIVSQNTIMLENNIYETTTVLKVSATGEKISKGQLEVKKRAAAREDAKEKRSAHVADLSAELEARAKKFGFDTVEEYMAWQKERNKGKDAGLDGLQGPNFNSGKSCGIAKAGDRENKKDWKKK